MGLKDRWAHAVFHTAVWYLAGRAAGGATSHLTHSATVVTFGIKPRLAEFRRRHYRGGRQPMRH